MKKKTRQRRIIARLAISADGYIARADGSVDFLNERPHPKHSYGMGEFYKSIDTILWGRKTIDTLLEFQKQGIKGARFDTKVKNYGFSRRPQPALSGVEFVTEPIRAFAARLRATPGKDIWMMGGAGLIASFLDEGELDVFSLDVVPVMIGEGIPLVAPQHRRVPLKLVSTRTFEDSVVHLEYAVVK